MLTVRDEACALAVFPAVEDAVRCLTTTVCVRNCITLKFKCTCGISTRMADEDLSIVTGADKSGMIFASMKNFIEFIACLVHCNVLLCILVHWQHLVLYFT